MIITETKSSEVKGIAFQGTVQSGIEPTVEIVLIGYIPISTYFGNDMETFIQEYKDKGTIDFTLDITLSSSNLTIQKLEKRYQSDGQLFSARKATFTDIVDIYAYVEVPVQYTKTVEPKDFFHLDLNPTPGHRHTIATNGFHQWIPTDKNEEPYVQAEVFNTELLAKQLHMYMRPSVIRYVDSQNPVLHGKPITGTMRINSLFHTDEEFWFNPKDYKYDPTMLRLGKIMLQANSIMTDNMTILDTRTRGGGLDESLSKEIIKQVNKESMYHWDIGFFDGEAYQENGVIVVRVPRTILKSDQNPNGFHESEVQAAIAKHKAYGVLPIIEYYEPVADEYQYNLIPNRDFLNGQHIGYFDPARSIGAYEIKPLGIGNNHALQITNAGEYAITIPGYKFKSNRYRLDIKALKDQAAPIRSAGTVQVFYKDGTNQIIQLGLINQDQWTVYQEFIDMNPNVHHVTITLNKTSEYRIGQILYDYVALNPAPAISEETTEIHEI